MMSEQQMLSVFDRYHKLEDPSAFFDWVPTPSNFRFSKDDIVCDGQLQEIDQGTSLVHSARYFAATTKHLLSFSV